MQSHFIFDTLELYEAKGVGSIKNRPGLVLKKKTQVSEKGKAFTTGKWMKAAAEQHKVRLRKHEETVVNKKMSMEKNQKALDTLGKHETAGTQLKKNTELLNTKLDERPDVRKSMISGLEKVRKDALDSGNMFWLDASERAIASVGGDLGKYYKGAKLESRINATTSFGNLRSATIYNGLMRKTMEAHGIDTNYFKDPGAWEAKNGNLTDSMKVAATAKKGKKGSLADGFGRLEDWQKLAGPGKKVTMDKNGYLKVEDATPEGKTGEKVKSTTTPTKETTTKTGETAPNATTDKLVDMLGTAMSSIIKSNEVLTSMVTKGATAPQGAGGNKTLEDRISSIESKLEQLLGGKKDLGNEGASGAEGKVQKLEAQIKELEAKLKSKESKPRLKGQEEVGLKIKGGKHQSNVEEPPIVPVPDYIKNKQEGTVISKASPSTHKQEEPPQIGSYIKKALEKKAEEKKVAEKKKAEEKKESKKEIEIKMSSGGSVMLNKEGIAGSKWYDFEGNKAFLEGNISEDALDHVTVDTDPVTGSALQSPVTISYLKDGPFAFDKKDLKFYPVVGKDEHGNKILEKNPNKMPSVLSDVGAFIARVKSGDSTEFIGSNGHLSEKRNAWSFGSKDFVGILNSVYGHQSNFNPEQTKKLINKFKNHEKSQVKSGDKSFQKFFEAPVPVFKVGEDGSMSFDVKNIPTTIKGYENLSSGTVFNPLTPGTEHADATWGDTDKGSISSIIDKGMANLTDTVKGMGIYFTEDGKLAPELALKKGQSLNIDEHAGMRKRLETVSKIAKIEAELTMKQVQELGLDLSWVGASSVAIKDQYKNFAGGKGALGRHRRSLIRQAQKSLGLHAFMEESLASGTITARPTVGDWTKGKDGESGVVEKNSLMYKGQQLFKKKSSEWNKVWKSKDIYAEHLVKEAKANIKSGKGEESLSTQEVTGKLGELKKSSRSLANYKDALSGDAPKELTNPPGGVMSEQTLHDGFGEGGEAFPNYNGFIAPSENPVANEILQKIGSKRAASIMKYVDTNGAANGAYAGPSIAPTVGEKGKNISSVEPTQGSNGAVELSVGGSKFVAKSMGDAKALHGNRDALLKPLKEVTASAIDKALGWDLVPQTTVMHLDTSAQETMGGQNAYINDAKGEWTPKTKSLYGVYSVQEKVQNMTVAENKQQASLMINAVEQQNPGELRKAALFSFLIGSQDMHSGNVAMTADGGSLKIKMHDNGDSMPIQTNTVGQYSQNPENAYLDRMSDDEAIDVGMKDHIASTLTDKFVDSLNVPSAMKSFIKKRRNTVLTAHDFGTLKTISQKTKYSPYGFHLGF